MDFAAGAAIGNLWHEVSRVRIGDATNPLVLFLSEVSSVKIDQPCFKIELMEEYNRGEDKNMILSKEYNLLESHHIVHSQPNKMEKAQ